MVLVPTNDKSVDTFTVRLKQNIQQDRQFIKMDAKLFNIDERVAIEVQFGFNSL